MVPGCKICASSICNRRCNPVNQTMYIPGTVEQQQQMIQSVPVCTWGRPVHTALRHFCFTTREINPRKNRVDSRLICIKYIQYIKCIQTRATTYRGSTLWPICYATVCFTGGVSQGRNYPTIATPFLSGKYLGPGVIYRVFLAVSCWATYKRLTISVELQKNEVHSYGSARLSPYYRSL